MGMFDEITVTPMQVCRQCGEPLAGWQSKDDACLMRTLPFWKVNRFYTSCWRCHTWHEFVRREVECPLTDYRLFVGGPAVDAAVEVPVPGFEDTVDAVLSLAESALQGAALPGQGDEDAWERAHRQRDLARRLLASAVGQAMPEALAERLATLNARLDALENLPSGAGTPTAHRRD